MCPFASGFFDSAEWCWDPSMLCVTAVCFYYGVELHCMDSSFLNAVYQWLDVWFVSSLRDIKNKAAVNIFGQGFVWARVSNALEYIPRSEMARCMFNYKRNHFPKELYPLHSYQQCMRVPVPPYICGTFFWYPQCF